MPLRLEPRPAPAAWLAWAAPILSVAATAVLAGMVFALMGFPMLPTLHAFFVAPLATWDGWGDLLIKAAPLVLIAEGLAFGFRANLWNIGAEGQLTMGAVAASGVALAFWGEPGWWVLPLLCAAGAAGGMAWAAVPAWLRARFGASEILVSLMLTYVAQLVVSALVFGPWKDPEGFNFPQSRMFSENALLPGLVDGMRPTLGTLLSFLSAPVAAVVVSRSLLGFQGRVSGLAPAAARYAGFGERRMIWAALLASGFCAGLAGAFEVAGPIGQLIPQVSPGYGFTAIIVAFLGRLDPLAIVPAGLLMALSYLGGETAQVAVGLPRGAAGLVQGMLLFLPLASDFLVRYRVAGLSRRGAAARAVAAAAKAAA